SQITNKAQCGSQRAARGKGKCCDLPNTQTQRLWLARKRITQIDVIGEGSGTRIVVKSDLLEVNPQTRCQLDSEFLERRKMRSARNTVRERAKNLVVKRLGKID